MVRQFVMQSKSNTDRKGNLVIGKEIKGANNGIASIITKTTPDVQQNHTEGDGIFGKTVVTKKLVLLGAVVLLNKDVGYVMDGSCKFFMLFLKAH